MDELNKTQIVLLTIFITFVTSIATGIVTVTLMDQSPPGITQTVTRVVEKTIEKAMPSEIVKEVRVAVPEGQLVADAIKKLRPAIVKIYPEGSVSQVFSANEIIPAESQVAAVALASFSKDTPAIGVVISPDGLIVTAAPVAPGNQYTIVLENGSKYKAGFVTQALEVGPVYLLKVLDATTKSFAIAKMNVGKPTLGQMVVALGYDRGGFTISSGIVTHLPDTEELTQIQTNIQLQDFNIGGPVINVDGEMLGVVVSKNSVLSSGVINSLLSSLPAAKNVPVQSGSSGQ
ncbi:MAG: serine protease [Candidatus Paceibacterota bacterium]|jgi:S1-C subfamily serine protease